MTLNFVTGAGSCDHDGVMTQQMARVLHDDPRAQILVIVPNHIKFDSEVAVLRALREQQMPGAALYAQHRVQIMSFSRLAWFFLKDDTIFQQPRLSPAAMAMRLTKIMTAAKDELHLFASQVTNPGFAARLQRQISELAMGRVTANDLLAAVATLEANGHNGQQLPKLRDLARIMQQFEAETVETVSAADLMTALADKLAHTDLSHTYLFLSHFNALAAQELAITQMFMTRAASVTVSLITDANLNPRQQLTGVPGELPGLYVPAQKMQARLLESAKSGHVAVGQQLVAGQRDISPTMQNVETFFKAFVQATPLKRQSFKLDQTNQPDFAALTLATAPTPYIELRTVARQIHQKVQQGARYRDFLILARRLDPYMTIAPAVFREFKLPFFIDRERQMSTHPLVVLIDQLAAIQQRHFDYQSVFGLLRTELLRPAGMSTAEFRAAVDTAENHVLATGIRGQRWLEEKPWVYYSLFTNDADQLAAAQDDAKSVQLNQIKTLIAKTVAPFLARLSEAKTGRELVTTLYDFLLSTGIKAQLTAWRDEAEAAGNLNAAQGNEQAWQVFCQLLDDFATTWGDTALTLTQFIAMLDAGFASATYTQIPGTLDQVQLSETGLVRRGHVKHVYLIGATAAALPEPASDTELLSQSDRSALSSVLPEGCFLPDTGSDGALGEPFLNYLALMSSRQTLTMSYPLRHVNGENEVSPYLEALAKASGISWTSWQAPQITDAVTPYLGTARSTLSDVLIALRRMRDKQRLALDDLIVALGPDWAQVIRQLRRGALGDLANRLLASLDDTNASGRLQPTIARALYGEHLDVSVSRLETYFKNPFEYFLKYGLALSPRREFTLTPADTGLLFHSVMAALVGQDDGQNDLVTLDDAALKRVVSELLTREADRPEFAILSSTMRMAYIKSLVEKTLRRSAWAVRNQQRRSAFSKSTPEISFGMGHPGSLPPILLHAQDNQTVRLRGRIDRLDTQPTADGTAFMVVDYKSGNRRFEADKAYYGLSIQMLTYLAAVIRAGEARGEKMTPVAGVYLHLQDPRLDYAPVNSSAALDELVTKAMKLQGILINTPALDDLEPGILTNDDGFTPSTTATDFNLSITKAGQPKKGSLLVTLEDLKLLLDNNDALIAQAAADILAGIIDLAPRRFDHKGTVISNSDYRAIMQFDPTLSGNRYTQLQAYPLDLVLARLRDGIAPYPNATKGED